MIHTFIGQLGSLMVNTAFITAILTAVAYWMASRSQADLQEKSWRKFGRISFMIHGLAVMGTVACLFFIIYNHYYEYHYAWSHSSNNLPVHFMISCFWEGQEGSFLLWIFWNVLLGFVLLKSAKNWEKHVMPVFAIVQAFLVSMILGVVIFNLKIGSSPFILLRDVIDAPIFKMDPNFVPEDGNGLNPLLQNYWMVIHPPTLFLGFAATLVPFAFLIGGLQCKKFSEWVKPALAWSHFAALVLGLGIMMGAYWAYETLNFGGYWNWDPVENAVYIPWLVLVGAIHVMIIYRNNHTALKTAMILVIATFILILYSTFLTRSGILGESSVHSFTDLGLSGQLLIYLFAFIGISVYYLAKNWKEIPTDEKEVSTYSREFWIFIGATTLCLAGFQVLIPTSIPVWNAILGLVGIDSNMAPPADQVEFYTKFQLWAAVAVALLSGTGQFFFWKKMDKQKFQDAIKLPVAATLIASALIISLGQVYDIKYIVLLTTSLYSVVANIFILFKLIKSKFTLVGGAVAHMGLAMMFIGILFSSGYSNVISLNMTGRPWSESFEEEMNRENLLIFRNEPRQMGEYTLTYKGPRAESEDIPGYFDRELLISTGIPYQAVLKDDIVLKGNTYAKRGDTIQVYNENTYYEIEYRKADGKVFTLYPRVQDNPQMGIAVSPDILNFWSSDIYTHLTTMAVDDDETHWSEPEHHEIAIGDTVIINDYFTILENVVRVDDPVQFDLTQGDFAVKARLRVLGLNQNYYIEPLYVIKDKRIGTVPNTNRALGIRATFEKIDPESGKFSFSIETSQKDWIVIKAEEKPFINVLWIGTILMCIGFGIAMVRRFSESKREILTDKSDMSIEKKNKAVA
ncbi:cytochrome c biogenesis protein CcsA [Rapidithrix thailandica]|uniref:Cytochrome c biogenesis protein CcsA n=1 Tax=Rapidithrix thailandica TaxID=413964 RepID=A0AAW9S6H0_9BACT